jgi:hypothetical protein
VVIELAILHDIEIFFLELQHLIFISGSVFFSKLFIFSELIFSKLLKLWTCNLEVISLLECIIFHQLNEALFVEEMVSCIWLLRSWQLKNSSEIDGILETTL